MLYLLNFLGFKTKFVMLYLLNFLGLKTEFVMLYMLFFCSRFLGLKTQFGVVLYERKTCRISWAFMHA